MRRWATILLMAAIMPAARAEAPVSPISIEQLEQLVTTLHGQSDRKAARRLSELKLTERASSARLAQWEAALPGRRCHDALTALADASVFLELPAADLAAKPTPSTAEQRALLKKAVDTTIGIIHRLPNFYATRLTEHFDDAPVKGQSFANSNRASRAGAMPPVGAAAFAGLHAAGTSKVTVSYRDGHETRNAKTVDFVSAKPEKGLATTGEFGPILLELFNDAAGSPMRWAYWVRTAHGESAVFRYTVPAEKSHFLVILPYGRTVEKVLPAYHGELEIDPDTGAILRITIVAAMAPPDQSVISSIAVEYGTVNIGGRDYVCPVKGVALSKMPVGGSRDASAPMQTELNDVEFVDYHLFRSESRILTDVPVESGDATRK